MDNPRGRETLRALSEQLDLAEPKVTATLLHKQIEFLFARQLDFSVIPRSSDMNTWCIPTVILMSPHGVHIGSDE